MVIRKKISLGIGLAIVLVAVAYAYYTYALNLPNSSSSEEVAFTIRRGESVATIADRLQAAQLIRSAALFRLYIVLNDLSATLQAGDFNIPRNLNVKEVAAIFNHGTFDRPITFIEGWRREEMAEHINSKFKIQNSKLSGVEFLQQTEGLEGYLFPDTYSVSPQTTTADLIRLMRDNFERKVKDLKNDSGLSFEEALIIASIVEREAKFAEDKPIVAGILIKRFLNGWPLQADASVQYALGRVEDSWWKKSLTHEDLKIESAYNTYLNPGLPPTPICNPGLDSIRAALQPEKTDYWYYNSDREGKIHFSVTNEEHNQNVARYL